MVKANESDFIQLLKSLRNCAQLQKQSKNMKKRDKISVAKVKNRGRVRLDDLHYGIDDSLHPGHHLSHGLPHGGNPLYGIFDCDNKVRELGNFCM